MTKTKCSDTLKISEIIRKFKEEEESPRRHKGTFTINTPFEEAVKSILNAKPETKRKKRGHPNESIRKPNSAK